MPHSPGMSLHREDSIKTISDRLNELASALKSRSGLGLTDGAHILETIVSRFFNVLFSWDLKNLNLSQSNYPAADLGDSQRRIAVQVTIEGSSGKIKHSADKAAEHKLAAKFDRLIVFFLLPKKPGFPRDFAQPPGGPTIEIWDIVDLVKQLEDVSDLKLLASAANVLDEEMGKIPEPRRAADFDISRILKYAPVELVGREAELKRLSDAWDKAARAETPRPHVLTFVAMGGEGKTSLVAKWAAELAARDWPGCDAAFAWPFYSQGSRDQQAASSELFIDEALKFFGFEEEKKPAANDQQAPNYYEKAKKLARIIGQRRCLLILDGLEPLQYSPTSQMPGALKDQNIAALLKVLAATSQGLCVVTTRYSLPNLNNYRQTTAPEVVLRRLSTPAGVDLLQKLGVRKESGSKAEFEKLVEDVKGHALTLNLLGTYLRDYQTGDIRRRDLVKLGEANAEEQNGHAFHVMDAYVKSLEAEGDKGRRAVAMLRLMGLFDRPATADCLGALWKDPAIAGLTEPLAGQPEAQRNFALQRLEEARLLTVNREPSGALISIDAHPLIREYFAQQVKSGKANAWSEAHRRLYKHLCETAPEVTRITSEDQNWMRLGLPLNKKPTLDDIQPLYQAIAHGCQAGLQLEACDDVYFARIARGNEGYAVNKLGAFGAELGAVACFFDEPWRRVSSALSDDDQAWLLNEAAFRLRALGRLTEALEPMRVSGEMRVKVEKWREAAISYGNLSELELTLGMLGKSGVDGVDYDGAVKDGEKSVIYADRSGNASTRMINRTTHADALHQAGHRAEAESLVREAEQLHKEQQPDYPLLYSLPCFRYCYLLLATPERAAWQSFLSPISQPSALNLPASCQSASQRAAQTLKWVTTENWLLDIALDHLTLGRAAFYQAILENSDVGNSKSEIEQAVSGLRRANRSDYLPRSLLTRAWLRFLLGTKVGAESAQEDLDEAWEIAERGLMKLHMADIHLHRARLFFREAQYPWNKNPDGSPRRPADDLAAARKLIETCGYHRRDEELADAEAAILGGALEPPGAVRQWLAEPPPAHNQ